MSDELNIKDVQAKMAELTDRELLKWLTEGKPLVGPEGEIILDGEGKPILRGPNASEMRCILSRVKELGLSGAGSESPSEQLRHAAKTRGLDSLKFPALDTEGQDEATGARRHG